jgi:hypothetical protein
MENCFDKAYKAADSGQNQMYSQISEVLQPDDLQRLKVGANVAFVTLAATPRF